MAHLRAFLRPPVPTHAHRREESGRLTDGRHFKRFWLRGPGGRERLVVSVAVYDPMHPPWGLAAHVKAAVMPQPALLTCIARLLLLTAVNSCARSSPFCAGQRRGQQPQGPPVQVPG